MFFFNKPNRKQILAERANTIKKLANDLNAKYYYGFNDLKDSFKVELNSEFEDSNIILGNTGSYDYCFLETYRSGGGKTGASVWFSKLILKIKKFKIPDFTLIRKQKAIKQMIVFFLANIIFIVLSLDLAYSIYNEYKFINNFNCIFGYSICLLFVIQSLYLLSLLFQRFLDVFERYNYRILNKRFKQKYAVLKAKNPEKVCEFLTDEICSKIVDYPSDLKIEFHNNCTVLDFDNNEQLSFDSCNNKLKDLIEKVELFEDNVDFFNSFF